MIPLASPKLPPVLEFIQTRQKFCQLALDVVAPTKIADGNESPCFMNAYRYIDHSPAIEENAVYILDQDLAQFALVNNHRLHSCVGCSLVLERGQFFAIGTIESSYQFKPLDDLSTETLFEPYLLS